MTKLKKTRTDYYVKWDSTRVTPDEDGWLIEITNRASFPTTLALAGITFHGVIDKDTDDDKLPLTVRLISDPLVNPGEKVTLSVKLGETKGFHSARRGGNLILEVLGSHSSHIASISVSVKIPALQPANEVS